MYQGIYNGTKKHEPDLDKVLQRAFAVGLQKIFITAGNLEEAHKAVKLVREVDTAGMHIDKVRLWRWLIFAVCKIRFNLTSS